MKLLFLFLSIVFVVFSSQYVTIPKREVGILIGRKDAPVKIQLLYDPMCDDSAQFDVKFQQAFQSLSSQIRLQISTRFILLALPYHMAAHKLSQGVIYVLQNKGDQQALQLMRDFLVHNQDWDEQNIKDGSVEDLITKIAHKINVLFGLKIEDIIKQLQHGSKTDSLLRVWSKVAMGSMKIASTPRLRINGVSIDGTQDLSVDQLIQLMNSLFDQNKKQKIAQI